ncbi:MAG: hypothetical protein QNJ63_27530 [Calothrix sp. MO_192.B10]|nr:hypothetical protein [Calothrix sp. MO_192.B10]
MQDSRNYSPVNKGQDSDDKALLTRATQSDCRRRGELVLHPFSPT